VETRFFASLAPADSENFNLVPENMLTVTIRLALAISAKALKSSLVKVAGMFDSFSLGELDCDSQLLG
jgi:hypothetical protein